MKVRKKLSEYGEQVQVEVFSSLKGTGKPKVLNILTQWYQDQVIEESDPEEA